MTGQIGNYDVGFLTMKTESTDTSPSNTYTVGRVKQNLLANSWIGAWSRTGFDRQRGLQPRLRCRCPLSVLQQDGYRYLHHGEHDAALDGRNQARKFAAEWRDNEFTLQGEYQTVQANFNPEIGFIRRSDVTEYTGDASWNPILESSDSIRNLTFSAGVEYFESATTGEIETRTQTFNTGIRFQNSSSINFSIDENMERLKEPFQIRRDIAIAQGDHSFRRYQVRASSDQTERISGGGNVQWGDFWDGTRKSFGGNSRSGSTIASTSGPTTAEPGGSAQRQLYHGSYRNAVRLLVEPPCFLQRVHQYNSDRNEVNSNIRFNIIHRP